MIWRKRKLPYRTLNWPPEDAPFPWHSPTHMCHRLAVGAVVWVFRPTYHGPVSIAQEEVLALNRFYFRTRSGRFDHSGHPLSRREARWVRDGVVDYERVASNYPPQVYDEQTRTWRDVTG